MNKVQKEAAKACFALNEKLQEVLVSEDGNCFTNKNLHDNHVRERRLDADASVTIYRDDVADDAEEVALPKEKPLSKMNKEELLAAAKDLGLENLGDKTKAEIVAAIEAAQKGGDE